MYSGNHLKCSLGTMEHFVNIVRRDGGCLFERSTHSWRIKANVSVKKLLVIAFISVSLILQTVHVICARVLRNARTKCW
jgi:hypothetical protein